MLYPENDAVGSIDWLNEATVAYLKQDYARANVAAIMFNAESVESLRLLLLESCDGFGTVEPLGRPPE